MNNNSLHVLVYKNDFVRLLFPRLFHNNGEQVMGTYPGKFI